MILPFRTVYFGVLQGGIRERRYLPSEACLALPGFENLAVRYWNL